MDIEEDGRVYIASEDESAAQQARKIVESLTHEVKVGRNLSRQSNPADEVWRLCGNPSG